MAGALAARNAIGLASSTFLLAILAVDCGGSPAPDSPTVVDAGSSHGEVDAVANDAGLAPADAATASPDAGPDASSADAATTVPDAGGEESTAVMGWSVHKRLRSPAGQDLVLEQVPISFTLTLTAPSRLRIPATASAPERSWASPDGITIVDACWHPSGEVSALLLADDRTVSLARFAADLTPLSMAQVHDPDIEPGTILDDAGPQDLLANGLATDAARIAAVGEDVVAVVDTSFNSIVAYRASFHGAWSAPQRTLLEPPAALTPFLPTSGTFDTFGAMVDWFRAPLDVDEQGNAYVAFWANRVRLRAHENAFHDGLAPVPVDAGPFPSSSDVVITKMDPRGARLWSIVVGTPNEDEPYAIRARGGAVAVVGRSRRFPGFDNTVWDALFAVASADGTAVVTRTLPLDASGILLAVDRQPGGPWVLGGSDGWSQNPDGLSVLSYGTKLLLTLPAADAAPSRIPLAPGPRNNEIWTLVADDSRLWLGGDEDSPIMHTADGDLTQIHATGVLGSVPP